MAMIVKRIINKILGSSKKLPDYQIELDSEPLRCGAEVYITVDTEKNASKDEIRQKMSKRWSLRNFSLEKAFGSISRYVATFGIRTIGEGKRIEKDLAHIEGIVGCDIRAYYTPQGTGGEG